MFDKLIVSEPEGADFKTRRSYFMVSSLIVGVLFITAVVISIFAADFGLGSSSFELVEMIAPPEMAAIEPEAPRPQPPASTSQAQSQVPTRVVNMLPVEQSTAVPTTTSVVPNTQATAPNIPFTIGPRDTDPVDPGRGTRDPNETGPGGGLATTVPPAAVVKEPEPPAVVIPKPVKIVSDGVVNGKATHLPVPAYPAAAKAVGITGKVDVQVMIDESGKVVSASAVSGPAMLRGPAEKAAWSARFSTTYLSKVPVKVTGVIVYNFSR